MHSQEQRQKAVELFIKNGKSHSAVIRALGYGSRWSIDRWYQDFLKDGFVKESRTKWFKFSDEQKVVAVDYYLNNGFDASKTVRDLGYPSRTLLSAWVDELAGGVRKPRKKRIKCSDEQKINAVIDLYIKDKTVQEVAAKWGGDKVTLYNWRRELLGKKACSIMGDILDEHLPEDIESLKAEKKKLEQELHRLKLEMAVRQGAIEIVKKDQSVDLKNLTNKEKMALVDAMISDGHKRNELLDCVGIAKSSYYYQRTVAAAQDKYALVRQRIKEIFDDNDGNWGYRRIWGELKTSKDPIKVSEKVVRNIMRAEGLKVVYIRKMKRHWSSYAGEISDAPENLVKRDFHAKEPDQLWLTDITQFTLPGFKCYLSPIIDCFDGKVVSWTISQHPNAELANTMLKTAISGLSPWKHPVIHSDRGMHYRWPEWISICNAAGLVRSMSKKGCSPDNSACEGFFGRLKNEFFYYRDWKGIDYGTFASMLNRFIVYYNENRIKQSLGWMSPVQYRKSLGLAA